MASSHRPKAITAVVGDRGWDIRLLHFYDKKRATPKQAAVLARQFCEQLLASLDSNEMEVLDAGVTLDDDKAKRATVSFTLEEVRG